VNSAIEDQRPSFSDYYGRPKYQSLFRWIDRRKIHVIQRELTNLASEATIVDLGCGPGSILAKTRRDNDFPVAADHDPTLLANARLAGSTPLMLDLDADLPLASASIDVVLCTDVIEHIVEPGKVLAEISRVMRPGATVIIFTPPYDSVRWNLAEWLHRSITRRPADHISPFTGESLTWWMGRFFVDCRLGRVNANLSMYAIARKPVDSRPQRE
jgi:2-polyprenyl-3-methyl-5-hydroxy-6-metoxy-1,4-benzoquinol methylase